MWQFQPNLKLFLVLVVLLLCSYSAYSQEITAEELQGLPKATLIEIILTYDQALTESQADKKQTDEALAIDQNLLNQDSDQLIADEKQATDQETETKKLAELFEKSLTLREQEKKEVLIDKILIGTGSAIIATAITIIAYQFSQ